MASLNWRETRKGGTSYNRYVGGNVTNTTPATVERRGSGLGTGPTGTDARTASDGTIYHPALVGGGGSTGGSTGGSGSGGGSYGGGGGSAYAGGTVNYNPYGALLASYEDSYRNAINAYNAAYESAIGRIGEAYNIAANSARGNLASTQGLIGSQYDRSHGEVTRDAERALREAYINHMMNRRDLQQSLSAQGLNGGASETTLASLMNRYGNSRTGIEENRNTNITNLAATRDESLAKALMAFNSEIANLEQNRANQINSAEMARASQIAAAEQARAQMTAQMAMANVGYLNQAGFPTIGTLGGFAGVQPYNVQPFTLSAGYQTGLQNIANAMSNYTYNPSEVTNTVNPVSTQQAVNMSGSDYAKYLAQLEMMAGAQRNPALGAGLGTANAQTLAQMLAQLGVA